MAEESFIKASMVDDDILVLRLFGKLDVTTTPDFNAEIKKHLEEGKKRIIIDCAHLGFISSVGIGSLVTLQSRLKRQGGEVKLSALQGPAAEVMRIVNLDKLMNMYGDIEFARQSFAEST